MDRKRLMRIALILFFAWLFVYLVQNKLIFHPFKWQEGVKLPAFPGRVLEEVTFKTPDGLNIHGIWMGNASAATEVASSPRPVILFSHGNAGNVLYRLERLLALSSLPIDLLVYDYRGFGKSEGSPDVPGVIRDGEAAAQWLKAVKGIPTERMILLGESIGVAISVCLAKKLDWKIGGLVLESGFRSLRARTSQTLPILGPLALAEDLPADTLLPEFKGPLMIIHSKLDEVNWFSDSEHLLKVATTSRKRMVVFEKYRHNDPVWDDPAYLEAWKQYLSEL